MSHGSAFNGIHLRTENDAKDWVDLAGGDSTYLQMYETHMVQAGFASSPPLSLYIASGLLKSDDKDSSHRMHEHIHEFIVKKVSTSVFCFSQNIR